VDLANNGTYPLAKSNHSTLVVIWGQAWELETGLLELSGCPVSLHRSGHFHAASHGCPLRPNCAFKWSINSVDAHKADVLLVLVRDNTLLTNSVLKSLRRDGKPYRVLYQREALWLIPHGLVGRFDMDMSFRTHAGVVNPNFLQRPSALFANTYDDAPRPHFAMSLISDCHTMSHREQYVRQLAKYLGPHQLHQYGSCGDGTHVLPKGSYHGISDYKFYLSFENTISEGYVTEKLFHILSLGPIPVYMGAPDVMNITKTKSFINVQDFANPRDLADYLLHLASHPDEYNAYHAWRRSPHMLTDEYLQLVAEQVPGPAEVKVHADFLGHDSLASRRASCCRLCDLEFVQHRIDQRDMKHDEHAMPMFKQRNWINDHIFGGTLGD
jgi:hypothetical protein